MLCASHYQITMNALTKFLQKHGVTLLLACGLTGYIVVAGTTGSCSACSTITSSLGLPGPANEASAAGFSVQAGNTGASESNRIPAPAWSLPDLEGNQVSNKDFQGKVVLIDFWATWCPPCREMIPGLVELQDEYGSDKLAIVGVSLDQNGVAAVKPFAARYGINYTSLIGNNEITDKFGGIQAIPTSFLIDQQGNVVSKHVGFVSKKQLRKEIDALLAEKSG